MAPIPALKLHEGVPPSSCTESPNAVLANIKKIDVFTLNQREKLGDEDDLRCIS